MDYFAPPVERLIEEFARLPGIGQKSAQRLAFHVLDMPKEDAERFASAIREAKEKTFTCKRCQNLTDSEECPICADKSRDQKTICVVADPRDVIAFERTKEYRGLYHVLHGTLSPMGHVGPDDIRIRELVQRIADEGTEEVILATNPDTEGEATAMYICSSRSTLKSRALPTAFRSADISSSSMRSRSPALSRAAGSCKRLSILLYIV